MLSLQLYDFGLNLNVNFDNLGVIVEEKKEQCMIVFANSESLLEDMRAAAQSGNAKLSIGAAHYIKMGGNWMLDPSKELTGNEGLRKILEKENGKWSTAVIVKLPENDSFGVGFSSTYSTIIVNKNKKGYLGMYQPCYENITIITADFNCAKNNDLSFYQIPANLLDKSFSTNTRRLGRS